MQHEGGDADDEPGQQRQRPRAALVGVHDLDAVARRRPISVATERRSTSERIGSSR